MKATKPYRSFERGIGLRAWARPSGGLRQALPNASIPQKAMRTSAKLQTPRSNKIASSMNHPRPIRNMAERPEVVIKQIQ
jgi:hypothetical protein